MRVWAVLGVASSLGLGIVAACGSDSGGGATSTDGGSDALIFEPPPSLKPTALAVGGEDACVIMDDGRLRCWGSNAFGQLGNPQRTDLPDGGYTFNDSPASYPLTASVTNAAYVAPGGPSDEDGQRVTATCAVLSDAQVQCWGQNRFGTLGRGGTTTDYEPHPEARPVVNLGPSEQVITNGMTACAISGHRAWCWGRTQYWTDGGGGPSPSEVDLQQGLGVKQIALGQLHGVLLTDNASVLGWGNNGRGQVGENTGFINSLPSVVEIAAGGFTTCVRVLSGDVQCLGDNTSGMLGRGPMDASNSSAPAPVILPTKTTAATQIGMGSDHACALLHDGSVWCWGNNFYGGLGSGQSNGASVDPPKSDTPLKVEGLPLAAIAIGVGAGFTCAMLSDHSVMCWGSNGTGTLGQGTTDSVPHLTPVRVPL